MRIVTRTIPCPVTNCDHSITGTSSLRQRLRLHLNAHHADLPYTPAGYVKCPSCAAFFCDSNGALSNHLSKSTGPCADFRRQQDHADAIRAAIDNEIALPAAAEQQEQQVNDLAGEDGVQEAPPAAEPIGQQPENPEPFAAELDHALLADAANVSLLTHYMEGLYVIHTKWQEPLSVVLERLFSEVMNAALPQERRTRAYLAYQILPGLIRHVQRTAKTNGRPVEFLRQLADPSVNTAQRIIENAEAWKATAGHRPVGQQAAADDFGANRRRDIRRLSDRAERLRRNGRLTAAMNTTDRLQSLLEEQEVLPPATLTTDQAREILRSLNPRANELDVLPDPSLDPPIEAPIVITPERIRASLMSASSDSTSGVSGWTYAAMKSIVSWQERMKRPPHFVNFLSYLATEMLAGTLLSSIRVLMALNRAAILGKLDGGHRPLGIGDATGRVICRAICHSQSEQLGKKLAPIQLAVGVPGGCEIAARIAQLQFDRRDDDHQAFLTVDARNAFNSIRRRPIYEGLVTYCPSLIPLFRWLYGSPSALIWWDGTHMCDSETGCRQGDPLGMLLFAIGTQSTYLEGQALLRQREEQWLQEQRVNEQQGARPVADPKGFVVAIADDACFSSHPEVLFRFAADITDLYRRIGLEVVPHKSHIVGRTVEDFADRPDGFQLSTTGTVHLGVPIGTMAFRTETAARKIQQWMPPTAALQLLHPGTAFALLASCVQARPSYLAGACDPAPLDAALQHFDDNMDVALGKIGDFDPHNPDFKVVRGLPAAMGGLGFHRYGGPFSASRTLVSRGRTAIFLRNFPAEFRPLISASQSEDIWPSVVIDSSPDAPTRAAEAGLEAICATPTDIHKHIDRVKEHLSLCYQGIGDQHITLLTTDPILRTTGGGLSKAAYLLSASMPRLDRWLRVDPRPGSRALRVTPEIFRGALQVRTLSAVRLPAPPMHQPAGRCAACDVTRGQGGIRRAPYAPPPLALHCLSCQGHHARGVLTRRHNDLRDRLARLVHQALDADNRGEGVAVVKEVRINPHDDAARPFYADICVCDEAEPYYIEVKVVDPSTRVVYHPELDDPNAHLHHSDVELSALRNKEAAGAQKVADVAARAVEKEIISAYQSVSPHLRKTDIIPFVVEATGRLGPAARHFLAKLKDNSSNPKPNNFFSSFSYDASLIIHEYAGRLAHQLAATLGSMR